MKTIDSFMRIKFSLVIAFLFLALQATIIAQKDSKEASIELSNAGGVTNVFAPEDVTIYALPDNGGTSGNSRAPQGSQRYIRTVYLITAAELSSSGVPVNQAVNLIGFRYSAAQSVPTTGDFKVYLENTSDATYSKSSDVWADIIAPMTLSHDNPVTIPAATGFWDIPFVNGSAFTYTGGGLYVAFEYQNPSGTVSTGNTALCNTSLAGGLKNAFSTTTLPASVGATASAFRPGTRLGNPLTDVVEVVQVYSLGKASMPSGNPMAFSALVQNKSGSAITFDAVLTVFKASDGTVRHTDTQTATSLAAGATQLLTFAGLNGSVIEVDSVKVEVAAQPGETFTSNNRKVNVLDVNEDTFSYAQGPATSGVGANGGTIDLAVKYTVNTSTPIDQITVGFSTTGQPYTVSIWAADGAAGAPGTNLFTSSSQTTSTTPAAIAVNPSVAVNGDFYVGVTQTGTTNFGVLYQTESPIRSGTFFFRSPTGTGTWGDFAPNNTFRVIIEPRMVDGPIPVELTSFKASAIGDVVNLTWFTSTETNNKGFQVERKSINGDFSEVAFIEGNGTTTEVQSYSYSEKVDAGSYAYRLKQIDFDGSFEYSHEVNVDVAAPAEFALAQNFPNPFNPSTKISFSLKVDSKVSLSVFNILGQEVASILNNNYMAGVYSVDFDASNLNSGVYVYKIEAVGIDGKSFTAAKKMILTK